MKYKRKRGIQNDVRYQERTEMILDCEGSAVKDHFIFKFKIWNEVRGKASVFCYSKERTFPGGIFSESKEASFVFPYIEQKNTEQAPTFLLYHKRYALVKTVLWNVSNFSLLHKKVLWTFDKMSIEKRKNICYNKITKKEVQSKETLKS